MPIIQAARGKSRHSQIESLVINIRENQAAPGKRLVLGDWHIWPVHWVDPSARRGLVQFPRSMDPSAIRRIAVIGDEKSGHWILAKPYIRPGLLICVGSPST